MNDMSLYSGIFDILGTIAFAVSGAITAVKKRMDIFGVIVLAVMTAAGGGVIRDVVIGSFPPAMFKNPRSAVISTVTAIIVFVVWRIKIRKYKPINDALLWFDAVGLAAFTVTGVAAGLANGYAPNKFLLVFLGAVTGVGGGVLRDITVREMPVIFVKQVYAIASIIGAAVMVWLYPHYGYGMAAGSGFGVVLLIRAAAIVFDLNLPRR